MGDSTSMPDCAILDEDALLDIIEDVWGDQTLPGSPLAYVAVPDEQLTTMGKNAITFSSTDQEQEPKPDKPKKKRRRDRNRPWHEIARLESESSELERELQTLMASASKRARGALHSRNINAQLKTMLKENIEDIRHLEQYLLHQLDELGRDFPNPLMMTRVLPFDVQDNSIFWDMARSVDDQYKDMDRVIRRAELGDMTSEMVESYVSRTKSVYTGGQLADMLKFRAQLLTPFKRNTLEKALWGGVESGGGVTLRQDQNNCDIVLPVDVSSRVAVQKYEISIDNYTCTMRMVMKEFIENHRVVQVWKMLAEWQKVGAVHNVKTHEYGWGYLQPVGEKTTLSVGCILVTPTIDGLFPRDNCESIKSLTNTYQKMVLSRLQQLENQTMDQLVREKSSAAFGGSSYQVLS
ncbi:hypothetical protein PPTG_03321 [Phytophthora nicotianae INRA-310]|uniref:Uncharacterized protein n=1 Tax=Phytophthora nicotianae (strain INRA-310) TaxID=761204 RepID=W2R721_PHYN3|nr:hypothetical protein PPTG_03321 [Phytophthora nicotianae INRA-310]ETN20285.1 hypothetical protein PPTG_03321 [Phytophthora nicotianae INRA-310]